MVDGNIKDEIQDKLSLIADPHMGISIVEMGLVRDITVDEANKTAKVVLSPTNPGCMSIANVAMASKFEIEKLDSIDKAEIEVIDHMMADTINEMVNKEE